MSFVKKLKDILFEEEEYTEPIKIREDKKEEEAKIIKLEPPKMTDDAPKRVQAEPTSERDLFKVENNFNFPDFDEEEFAINMSPQKPKVNALDFERKKIVEKRSDHSRIERVENKEYIDKKKFRPSPIISPVYGILNQDYKAEDIVNKKEVASNINIEEVRKKAFEKKEEPTIDYSFLNKEETIEHIDEPVVTFFEEKDNSSNKVMKEDYKTIDALLEEASSEISLEDTLEIPKTNNLDVIEEELEKIDSDPKEAKDIDDELDNDLFELIDSMYDERGEE